MIPALLAITMGHYWMTDNSKLGNLTKMLKDDREKEQAGTSISSWKPSWWLIQTQCWGFRKFMQPRNSLHFKKKVTQKSCHKATRYLESHGHINWKGRHYPWLPDADQPKTQFLQAPREPRLSLSTHTSLSGGVVSSIGQVSAASSKHKAWQRL